MYSKIQNTDVYFNETCLVHGYLMEALGALDCVIFWPPQMTTVTMFQFDVEFHLATFLFMSAARIIVNLKAS